MVSLCSIYQTGRNITSPVFAGKINNEWKIFCWQVLLLASLILFLKILHGSVNQSPRTLISIGLCHGHNPQVYNKQNYPYTAAAIRSVKLWKHFLPHVQVKPSQCLKINFIDDISTPSTLGSKNVGWRGALPFFCKKYHCCCDTVSILLWIRCWWLWSTLQKPPVNCWSTNNI